MTTYEHHMAHALQQYVIADGKITLYQRDDVKNPLWQCRIRIKGSRGYVRRSTGMAELDRAKEVSLQILGELNQRKAQNLPMTRKTFAEVAAGFLKDAETRWKEGRNSYGRYSIIKGTVQRYLVPYFGNRDITLIAKKDLMDYRAWRQAYWITGLGRAEIKREKKPPTQATLKQEWTILRGVFIYGMDIGVVSQELMRALKHEKYTVNKRPAFTGQEYRQLYLFMRGWWKKTNNPRVAKDRALLREYVLIMTNSGMRKGEARNLKWRDVNIYRNKHGEWVTLTVKGKTGERLVVCQPGTQRYFDRLRKRGYRTSPDDLVFCHEDGLPIEDWTGFSALLKAAGLEKDTHGNKRSIYSLRHTYATFRLQHGTNVYWLKKNMGTSVTMIERHYGQTNVLIGIEHETAKRKKAPRAGEQPIDQNRPLKGKAADEIVPIGAVDLTPAEEDGDE